jgi:hypothetical protein
MRKLTIAAALVGLTAALPAFAELSHHGLQAESAIGASDTYRQGASNTQHDGKASQSSKTSHSTEQASQRARSGETVHR